MFSEIAGNNNDEAVRAHEARLALVGGALYPPWDLALDSGFAVLEGYQREKLPGLLDRLSRTDLMAVYQLVNLLALNPRDDEVFAAVARQDARCRAVMGVEAGDGDGELKRTRGRKTVKKVSQHHNHTGDYDMDAEQKHQKLSQAVAMATKSLTDEELSQLHLAVEFGDPQALKFYDKIKETLFDEQGEMHEETKSALISVVNYRLGKRK